jgi:hypothetical protein
MADSLTITTNVADGTSLSATVNEGVTITTNVQQATAITANVVTGARGESGAASDVAWGDITGTLSDQADVQAAIDAKQTQSAFLDSIAGGSLQAYTSMYMPHNVPIQGTDSGGNNPAVLNVDTDDNTELSSAGNGIELKESDGTVVAKITESTTLDMLTHKIENVANGSASGDAVNKGQLDGKDSESATLTNKTISGSSNTVTNIPIATGLGGMTNGTFLTATGATTAVSTKTAPAGTVVGTSDTQTLTSKTLTAPKFADGGFIADANGNEQIVFHQTGSAVNQVGVTNSATGSAVIIEAEGGDTNIHLVARGKGNGLTKVSVLEQLNTTNGYKHNSVILTGWGIFAQGAAANKSEAVTFGITFAAIPIVLATYGGDSAAANTSYGSGGNTVKGPVCIKAHTLTTTGFTAHIHTSDGTSWGATDNTFYQWLAVGQF